MGRRIVKPFAVEIRKAGQRVKTKPASVGFLTLPETEQPQVTRWPGIDQEPAGPLQMPELAIDIEPPVGRILPALNQPAALEAVRKPKKRRPQTDAVPIDEPLDDPKPMVDPEPMVEEEPEGIASAADAEVDIAPVLRRKDRARRPRHAFKRSERWKARLPAVVYCIGNRRRT